MLSQGKLVEFIQRIVEMENEEREQKVLWDMWLHKEYESTWEEFIDRYKSAKNTEKSIEEGKKCDLEAIVARSNALLDNFKM